MFFPINRKERTEKKTEYEKVNFVYDETRTTQNCNYLLKKNEETIENGYLYLEIIECYKIYLELMSFADILSTKKTENKKNIFVLLN
jgi:hypothetical protein